MKSDFDSRARAAAEHIDNGMYNGLDNSQSQERLALVDAALAGYHAALRDELVREMCDAAKEELRMYLEGGTESEQTAAAIRLQAALAAYEAALAKDGEG